MVAATIHPLQGGMHTSAASRRFKSLARVTLNRQRSHPTLARARGSRTSCNDQEEGDDINGFSKRRRF